MINSLQRFMITVDEGSITQAAKKLHLTQPALSTSLKKLEKELNTKLFIIRQKQMSVTVSGENVYRVAKKIIELWEITKGNLHNDLTIEKINIGLFDNAALRLAGFLQQQPYNVTIDRSVNLIKDLTYGLIDIAVVVKNLEEAESEFNHIGETKEELLPVGNTISRIPFKEIPFILYNEGSQTRKYIENTFLSNGIKPNIVASSSSTTFMKELALHGGGVALLPKNFILQELESKKLFIQKLPIKFYRTIAVIVSKNANEKITRQAEIIKKLIA